MDYSWRLYALINIAGCVKKESKKITTGSSVDKIVKEKTEKKETQNTKRKETKKQLMAISHWPPSGSGLPSRV